MNDIPYTSPDEDPFHVSHPHRTITRARSTMLDKWIHDQTPYSSPSRAMSNPYLAYPDLPRASSHPFNHPHTDDAASVLSYDLVDDDDIPAEKAATTPTEPPKSPIRTPKSSRHSITPSFRNLALSFRGSPSKPSSPSPSRTFSRIFPRTPRSSTEPPQDPKDSQDSPCNHARSSSLSTLALATPRSNKRLSTSTTTSRWRPSVLGHFYQPTASDSSIHVSDTHTAPSRPSISSGDTHSSSNVTTTSHPHTSVDTHVTSITSPSKLSLFDSIRVRANRASASFSSLPAASSCSLSRHSRSSSHDATSPTSDLGHYPPSRTPFAPKPGSILDNIDDVEDLDCDPPATLRPFKKTTRPPIPSASSLPRVKFGSISSLGSRSLRKRKKLVISGIAAAETRKLDGIKRWCETFGEIRTLTRVPNGDLHIDFRDPEVADTVCRVRAKVYIAGVGSVQLSWIHANKRS